MIRRTKIYFRFLDREQDRYHTRISTSLSIGEENFKNYLEKIKRETRDQRRRREAHVSGKEK